jgi:LysM repeat protein
MAVDLNSPFGYDLEYEADFKSMTSSCSKGGYTYTTPGSYSLAPTSTTSSNGTAPSATPSCRATHVVQPDEKCYGIAMRHDVSSFSIAVLNGLDPACSNLTVGSNLCIGDACSVRQVQVGDSCVSILQDTGIDPSQLMAWNPNLDALCSNLHDAPAMVLCVGYVHNFHF